MEEAIVVECVYCGLMQGVISTLKKNNFAVRTVKRDSEEGLAILAEGSVVGRGTAVKIADTVIANANSYKIRQFVASRTKKTEKREVKQ